MGVLHVPGADSELHLLFCRAGNSGRKYRQGLEAGVGAATSWSISWSSVRPP